jgi:plastocyanin
VRFAFALLIAAATALALVASACGGAARADGIERTITIHYSRFEPALLEVPAGVPVKITLVNNDPIDHEWLIGDAAMHERHRTGTEPFHASRPTEVTVPAHSTRVTTLTFGAEGLWQYICHLPAHEQYGMVGTLRAVE